MASDLSNLNLAAPFSGNDSVTTTSGLGLPISHIGFSTLHTPQYAFELKKILHVPQLSQHLLSIYNCVKILNADSFVMNSVFGSRTRSQGP